MTGSRQRLGRAGEEFVAGELPARGWGIVARNWRMRGGELDIVARDGATLVFVEVKARRGAADEWLSPRQAARLTQTAAEYLRRLGWDGPWRVDLAAVTLDARGAATGCAWFEDAVNGE